MSYNLRSFISVCILLSSVPITAGCDEDATQRTDRAARVSAHELGVIDDEESHSGPRDEPRYRVLSHERTLDRASGPGQVERAGIYEIAVADQPAQRLRYTLTQSFSRGPANAELHVYDDGNQVSSSYDYNDALGLLNVSTSGGAWKVAGNPNGTVYFNGVDYASEDAAAQSIVANGLVDANDAAHLAVAVEVGNMQLADLDKKTKAGKKKAINVGMKILALLLLFV